MLVLWKNRTSQERLMDEKETRKNLRRNQISKYFRICGRKHNEKHEQAMKRIWVCSYCRNLELGIVNRNKRRVNKNKERIQKCLEMKGLVY
jgi:epoxyqueuosine reductase QueG